MGRDAAVSPLISNPSLKDRLAAVLTAGVPSFYTYYIQNDDQVALGRDLDNARYPHVKPERLEAFLKRTSAF